MLLRVALAALLAGCGDGGGTPECLVVDGRGGPGADGSEARPFATIDEALGRAADGDTICLRVGDFVAPLSPVSVAVTIVGAGEAGTEPTSTIDGGLGGCAEVRGFDLGTSRYDRLDLEAVLVTAADVTLRHLAVRTCRYGVVASRGRLTLDDVLVDTAFVAVAAARGVGIEVTGSRLRSGGRRPASDGPQIGVGVLGGQGATVVVRSGSVLDGGGGGVGIHGAFGAVETSDTTIEEQTYGFYLELGEADCLARIGPGTLVRRLRASRISSVDLTPFSGVVGGRVEVDGARFEESEADGYGLQLERVDASVRDTTFTGHPGLSLGAFGSTVRLDDGVVLDVPADAVGLRVASTDGASASLTSTAAMSSSGPALAHAVVAGDASLTLVEGTTLTGGRLGVSVVGATASLAGVSLDGQTGAALRVEGDGATLSASDTRVVAGAAGAGAVAFEGAALALSAFTSSGGDFGVGAADGASIDADRLDVTDAAIAGVALLGSSSSTISGATVERCGIGVVALGGHALDLRESAVRDSAGAGVAAQDSTLRVLASELSGNSGASVVYTDSSGAVAGTLLLGTVPDADGRADEITIVSTDGARHAVEIGDDGDGVLGADDENHITVSGARDCAAGTCSVALVHGDGAVGIVRPNCIVREGAPTGVFTLVDQEGGAFEEPEAVAWPDLLAGRATDLGFVPSAVGAVAAPRGPALPPQLLRGVPGEAL